MAETVGRKFINLEKEAAPKMCPPAVCLKKNVFFFPICRMATFEQWLKKQPYDLYQYITALKAKDTLKGDKNSNDQTDDEALQGSRCECAP